MKLLASTEEQLKAAAAAAARLAPANLTTFFDDGDSPVNKWTWNRKPTSFCDANEFKSSPLRINTGLQALLPKRHLV